MISSNNTTMIEKIDEYPQTTKSSKMNKPNLFRLKKKHDISSAVTSALSSAQQTPAHNIPNDSMINKSKSVEAL